MKIEIQAGYVVVDRATKSGGALRSIASGAFWHKAGSAYPLPIKVALGDARDAPELKPGRYTLDLETVSEVGRFGDPELPFGWGRKLTLEGTAGKGG